MSISIQLSEKNASKKSQARATKSTRAIQYPKVMQREAGMLDLRDTKEQP